MVKCVITASPISHDETAHLQSLGAKRKQRQLTIINARKENTPRWADSMDGCTRHLLPGMSRVYRGLLPAESTRGVVAAAAAAAAVVGVLLRDRAAE
jgi:hypothetical protein